MTPVFNPKALYFPKRLTDSLSRIPEYSLTVAEAPSGFGKTTALDFFFGQPFLTSAHIVKHTFFSSDIAEYWRCFCQMAEQIDPVSADALKALGTPCGENMSRIHEITDELSCENETYFVLDNLTANEKDMNILLTALSHCSAEKLHTVLSVQTAGTKFHSFVSDSGNVYFIDASDFAFSAEDCRAYFAAGGIVLTPDETDALYQITGGWIFAVCLQRMFYIKNRHFEKGILNSLIEKAFFGKLDTDEKNFYLSLAPLKSFTLGQAAEISEKSLDFVGTHLCGGGFVHYDSEKNAYYFHNLLSEYLRLAFDCLPREQKRRLYLAAAEWEEKHGEKVKALSLYYKAGDYERIFAMPHTSYDLSDIEDADTRTMIFDILDNTPYEIKLRYCESMVPLAFILFFIGENEKLFEVIEEIKELTAKSALSAERKNAVLGETELLISFTAFNNIAEMSRHHRKAYGLLGGKAALINLQSTWTFGSPSVLFLYHRTAGSLEKELSLMDECMPYYYALTDGHGSGAEFAMRAEACLFGGRLDDAERLSHRAAFEAQNKKQSSLYQSAQFVLALVSLLRRDENAHFDALFRMSESAASNTEDMCRYTADLFTGYLYAFTHRADKVCGWLADGDITETRLAPMTMPFAHVVYAKLLLEREEYSKLVAFCQFARKMSEALCTVLPQIYLNLFECCADTALRREKEAENAFCAALALLGGDELYLPFAQCFRQTEPLLKKHASSDLYETIRRFGNDFEKAASQIGSGKEKLTKREAEVVELIRQGFTNKQIAARLFISISTVKMTLSNIFDKTGVRSRSQLADVIKK